jgi:non-heme chloroperoxidase
MSYIKVGEENSAPIEIYYEDHGNGQPVVLIHGFPLNGASWEKQEMALLKDGYRVITYDRRGFGKSSKPSVDYNYDTFTDDLNVLMTKLDLRDAVLVGFSMGSGEVVRYLSTYGSERVSKAVLMSPIPPFLLKTSDNVTGIEMGVFEGFKKQILQDRPAFFKSFFENFYNSDLLSGKRIGPEAMEASFIVAVGSSAKATYDCVSSWLTDFRADVPRVKVPVLIVQGDKDRILPLDNTGRRLSKMITGSKLVVIKDGPHAIGWTHAEEVNNALIDFLSGEERHAMKDMERDAGLGLS